MRKFFSLLGTATALLLIAAGLYLLTTATASVILPVIQQTTAAQPAKQITSSAVYIPKIGVNIPYGSGDVSVLEHGAWWRSPASGNPQDGGNFVLAAHRFEMGWTPMQTARKSPLYHIEKLAVNDEIIVDYQQKRYTYKVVEIYRVAPTATDIEAPTEGKRLTLYTCTLGGASDGREVIIAEQM